MRQVQPRGIHRTLGSGTDIATSRLSTRHPASKTSQASASPWRRATPSPSAAAPARWSAAFAALSGVSGVVLLIKSLWLTSRDDGRPRSTDLTCRPSKWEAAADSPHLDGAAMLRATGQAAVAVLTASALTLNGLADPAPAIAKVADRPAIVLTKEEEANVQLFRKNTPSVVFVTNLATVGRINKNDWSLDLTEIPRGSGTGFVWDNEGHIVTNHHVIAGASDLRVTTIDQSAYKAKLLGSDEDKDVAVLQVTDPEAIAKFRPVTVGSSKELLVGQKVLAIGNPFGLDHTLTQGIISGLGRVITSPNGRPITGVVQTDAAINPGNSGGPLLDSSGKVIGMASAILDPTGQGSNSGVGFAIPIDIIKSVTDQLLTYGRILRPVMGITIAPDATLQSLNVEGVLVLDVPEGSPAAQAGIRPSRRDPDTGRLILGDIIVAIDGKKIANASDLFSVIDDFLPGDKVKVTILRDDSTDVPRKLNVTVTLGERRMGTD